MDEIKLKILTGQVCPYCECETKLVHGGEVYPHLIGKTPRPKFLDKKYYICIRNKDHYVGTYVDNVTSLGRVADYELRDFKKKGHETFDPLWKDRLYFKNQREAYKWLSGKMNLPLEFTHFGMFSIEECRLAIEYCLKINESTLVDISGSSG
jgi:hypothetical protein